MAGNRFPLKHSGFRKWIDAQATQNTAIDELIDDHATYKTLADELIADHATLVTWCTEADADLDTLGNYLDFHGEPDGVIGGNYTMAATGATTVLGAGRVRYRLGGIVYETALDTTITLEDNGDIVTGKYGAWRVLIAADGTVTTQDTSGAQMAFDNEEDALLSVAQAAQDASTVCIGYLTITKSDGAFNIGTTNTNAANVTLGVYYEKKPRKQNAGLTAALGASIALDAAAATYNTGTIDAMAEGLGLAQISAQTTKAFDDADTIGDTQFGGWVFVTGLAGTDTYALAADGIAGAVSAMSYASSAAVQTALDNVVDRLPSKFCPVGQLIITNASGGTFTAGTTNLDAAGITATFTDYTVGTWDRTSTTGADTHKVNPPAVPASVTAALLATLTATAPATLTASDPTDID